MACRMPYVHFLAVVTKRESRIRIYHTSPRFCARAHPPLPEHLELVPGEETEGKCVQWTVGTTFSLSAPILDFHLDQPDTDEEFRGHAAGVLRFWISVDEENLKRVKINVREFKMPGRYQTNALSPAGTVIQGLATVDKDDLERGISHLKDPLSSVTDQLLKHGDLLGAVRGMLLLRQLCWDDRHDPTAIANHASTLNTLLEKAPAGYFYEALDGLGNELDLESAGSRSGWHTTGASTPRLSHGQGGHRHHRGAACAGSWAELAVSWQHADQR